METITHKAISNLMTEEFFNGYSYFNQEEYKKKSNNPCFLSENSHEPRSYKDMFNEVLESIRTKDFLTAVCENYDRADLIDTIESLDDIDFDFYYNLLTLADSNNFAESFMDSYFLSGDDLWCSISTKIEDYKY